MQLSWLIAIPIILILLWLAWRRPSRKRLIVRLVASAVAGISLILFIYPPAITKVTNPSTAILLTEGFDQDTLKALLGKETAKPLVYSFGAEEKNAAKLKDLYTLRQQLPGLKTVHIVGYGLEKPNIDLLKGVQVVPHLTTTPPGIYNVQWPQNTKLGEAVSITGKFKNPASQKTLLYLHADGKLQDSVEVSSKAPENFSLKYVPKTTGKAVYTVLAKSNGQPDTLGHVPVQVNPTQQLGILLIASSPSFEFKFLKNHLASQQHKVAYRATVSRDISSTEWVNMPNINLSRITPGLLNKFDILITEPQALLRMSASERATLQRAVTGNGLGILTIASEPVSNRSTAFFTGFQTKRISQQPTRSTRLNWHDKTVPFQATSPYAITSSNNLTALIMEQGNAVLVGAKQEGWGKVALSLVPQTFQWQLDGKESIYADYWANLLTKTAKEQTLEAFWQLENPQVPKPDKPLTLTFTDYSAPKQTPAATITSLADSVNINLALAQYLHQPEKYTATFWPRKSGWYQVKIKNTEPYYFYIHNSSDWEFESIANKRAATLEFVKNQASKSIPETLVYHKEAAPLWWFFVLFVLSSSFLWLEEKF